MPNPGQYEEEAPDDTLEEPPHKKQKPMVKVFREAFIKDSEVVKAAQ